MKLKNTSILTIISVSSLGLLSSCGNKESVTKPATFSGSYKLVAISCGTRESEFTPEGVKPKINASNAFKPRGFYHNDNPNNRDFKIKNENGKVSFVYSEMKNNNIKCSYSEGLDAYVSISNANIFSLEGYDSPNIIKNPVNDSACDLPSSITYSLFTSYSLGDTYEFAQKNGQYTLTSESNWYCKKINSNWDEKLILTLEKE